MLGGKSEQPLKMDYPTRMEALSRLPAYLETVSAEYGLTSRTVAVLRLVLEELMTNSIMHGRAPPSAAIEVVVTVAGEDTQLLYSDAGFPFDPRSDLPPESRFDDLDDRPIGKLGWPLILHYCSFDDYTFAKGRNRMSFTLDQVRLAALGDG